jgi:riboflavin kinase/FMN adenylyltransferase
MQRFFSLDTVPSDFGPSAVTVGKFDGVHLGHRQVISRLHAVAQQRGLTSAIVTFDRNPLSLLAPERCPAPLVSVRQKLDLIESTGVDATLVLEFDRALSELAPEEFAERILVHALHAAVVLVGADFRFGAHGAGDIHLLRQLGAAHGFEVEVIKDVADEEGSRVSSTHIRDLLSQGRVRDAAKLLGALPTVRAEVVHGEQRGRTLGYPTANLSREAEGFLPADGVYAAWLIADGVRYPAAVSIGNNPTFGGVPDHQVEAHAMDVSLDLYGSEIEVAFVEHIRGMRKFEGPDALAAQMGSDERQIREILGRTA